MKFERRTSNLQLHRPPRSEGLIGGQHDAQAVDGIVDVVRQVDIFLDGAQEVLLFQEAEAVVVGLVVALSGGL